MKSKLCGIKKGDCILSEKPFVYVLQSKFRRERCDFCLSLGKVMKCGNCEYVYYCNRNCQVNAWSTHKIECGHLKRIAPETVPDAARMLSRIILKLRNGGDMEKSYYTETSFRKFHDMMSHFDELKADPKRMEHLESLEVVLKCLLGNELVPNTTELLGLYGRLITNGFNILDPEMCTIGTGIYLAVSVVDHSCVPNAVATFDGITLKIRVTEDMPSLDWSKIFICYIEPLDTSEFRRNHLKENYYFLCECSRCLNTQELSEMTAAICPNHKCNARLININDKDKCEKCNLKITNQFQEEYKNVMTFSKSKLDEMKEVAYLDVCKVCLAKQKHILDSLNLWHIKTLDCAFDSAIHVNNWENAIEFGPKLIAGYRKYCGNLYPLLGITYMKLGKIQILQGLGNDAEHNLNEAKKILEITHGIDSKFYQDELVPLLQNLQHLKSIY